MITNHPDLYIVVPDYFKSHIELAKFVVELANKHNVLVSKFIDASNKIQDRGLLDEKSSAGESRTNTSTTVGKDLMGMPATRRAHTSGTSTDIGHRFGSVAMLQLTGDILMRERDPFQNAICCWEHSDHQFSGTMIDREGLRPGVYSVAGMFGVPIGPLDKQANEPGTVLDKIYGFDWSGVGPLPKPPLSLLDKLALLRQFRIICRCVAPVPVKHPDPALFVHFCGTCKMQIDEAGE